MQDLGIDRPDYPYQYGSQGTGINASGQVMGRMDFEGSEGIWAFFYDGSTTHLPIGIGDADYSTPLDLNDSGQVVGWRISESWDNSKSFIYGFSST